jgi:hypothetical protein
MRYRMPEVSWNPANVADVLTGEDAHQLAAAAGLRTHQRHFRLKVQGREIRMKRSNARAREVIAFMPEALRNPEYIGRRSQPNQFCFVGRCGTGEYLLIAAKLVGAHRAATRVDELIVSTAHFVHESEVQRKIRNGQLTRFIAAPPNTSFERTREG